ncbi:MAG: HAMP domain-containing histidine kinase [Cyanobacteria bacterium]|nr:HAMP domain-containing histidine kinase [Cyanobacteria bacterium CG_2015-16_32_12]NCO79014.1 HAMP domain-containing histidine kinase [Cyanobacteria bacterium CG_2015-22_32_23]NCQ05634.1 HAMP domain-containing histidine kinase [Cyanobacteria bacterium CG_2015-09_32_10]NCQ41753.1 HAMP domain-containing histidine kinase [Cyanobacteria bacterium CG_2015-04_32_10]NCS83861.1 HAMP domain-containing histidine kinase [Cyanobacteria bacterium CG_2015-02_32_10]
MTEIKNLTEELTKTKLAYQESLQNSQFKAGFLGRISHEIRSPLSSLMGLHQLIINDLCESKEEEREFIEEAYKYAKKLMRIIDQLTEVSKIEVGRLNLEIQKVNLSELLEDIQEIMSLQAANRNLKLKLEKIEDNDNIIVNVDREKLTNILFFLLEVVIDYSEIGEIILKVVSKEETNQVIIKINFPSQHLTISENIDLIKPPMEELKQLNKMPQFSNGMKIMLGETLLEMMGGKLVINSDKDNNNATQWQIFLPVN